MSPQAKHRNRCSSPKEATLGSTNTSVMGVRQIGHGGAELVCGNTMQRNRRLPQDSFNTDVYLMTVTTTSRSEQAHYGI
jgi:hypothetical protein